MTHVSSPLAIAIFFIFVAITLGLSFFLGRKAKSSAGYFAAHGQIPWFVNGVAFAGDYLSAASFLGICGMIAFYGYDGFLYSIGYLAGWIVALFVVAEPMKRLGKFTFADALNAKFNSRGIKLAAGVSTLAVSIFYLIPQMVGAGALVRPLLGLPHWLGVVLVGAIVITIVVTAGMVSTTWVQFIKGALLIVFSTVLTVMILARGLKTAEGGVDGHKFRTIGPVSVALPQDALKLPELASHELLDTRGVISFPPFLRTRDAESGKVVFWHIRKNDGGEIFLDESQSVIKQSSGEVFVNGLPLGTGEGQGSLHPVGFATMLPDHQTATGPLGPLSFFKAIEGSEIVLWKSQKLAPLDEQSIKFLGVTVGKRVSETATIYYPESTSGARVLQPGLSPTFAGIRSDKLFDKLNFLSLMLALFCGTASLPHILIRYYTVKDEAAARKSTIVGIACIGFFYVLTLYMGLGAMTSGALDPTDSNMAAPLLARSISETLFAVISAIAFTTVLGTVSGLILASAGAVTHDLLESVSTVHLTDHQRVRIAKMASVVVGVIAIGLGILFKELNVSYLVGWAFSVAASANLPSLVMLLFWPRTTKQGIIAAVIVGMVSSLAWILLSGDTFASVYGLPKENSIVPFSQPGIVTIPLGFITLIVVSLLTGGNRRPATGRAGATIILAIAALGLGLATPCSAIAQQELTVAADGSGEFATIQSALDSIPRNNRRRVVVNVKDGVYYEKLLLDRDRVTLRGASRDGVQIRYNLPRLEYDKRYDGLGPGVVNVFANDLVFQNLTIENTQTTEGHAFAMYGQPNRLILDACNVLGVGGDTLSLWNTAYGMYYHRNCKFKGAVDFVCPRGWCFIRDSQFEEVRTSAALWHDGHMDPAMKFVLRNCTFDGVKDFWLGRNHYPSQFYLLDCKFSANMADKPIGTVADPAVITDATRPSFERKYFHNCHRDGGDYSWHADNDNVSLWAAPDAITPSWTFDGKWDPEGAAPPTIETVEVAADAVHVYFTEPVAGADQVQIVRQDGSIAAYAAGDGTRRLEFRGGAPSSSPRRLELHGDKLYGTVATLQPRLASSQDLPPAQPRKEVVIMLVGDSTVATDPADNPYQGWGSALGRMFDDRVKVVNLARNGRSSKSFRAEGLWDKARQTKADYVFIQFGHNDNLGKGPDRETNPAPGGDFRANLRRYVEEVRAMGAEPVLVSPPTRREFDAAGRIKADEANVPYAQATLAVAEEIKCPVIDLNSLSRELFERLGPTGSDALQIEVDRTHFSPAGARRIAAIVAEATKQQVAALKRYVLEDELTRR